MRTKNIRRSQFPMLSMLTRLVCVSVLLAALANAAIAYTLVFRDGHRIEVPSVFTVTPTTFTCEVAPGINKTVQLILIDVAGTERANNEAPGSFLKHAAPAVASASPPPTRRAERTLTNRDLEPSRQRRIESEKNYEQRRIELGLPSIEETRRRQALEEESTLALAQERAAAEANDEAYWHSRARTLRNEILTVDAEINYVRARLGPVLQFPLATQSFVTGTFGRPFAGRFPTGQSGAGRMGTMAAPPMGSQGLTNMGSVALRPSRPPAGFGFPRAAIGSSFPVLPFAYGENSYASADLSVRLNSLLVRRAGLEALWRELENEARIARVPQVWLAP
jgi:hypothetical protein